MMCFMRLAEMAPGPVAEKLLPELRRGVHLVTGDNPDDWRGYGGRPLWFAAAPDSPLSDYLQDSIQVQLDHESSLRPTMADGIPTGRGGNTRACGRPQEWNGPDT